MGQFFRCSEQDFAEKADKTDLNGAVARLDALFGDFGLQKDIGIFSSLYNK